jgi:DNA-binding MarR family transcriptional regulator
MKSGPIGISGTPQLVNVLTSTICQDIDVSQLDIDTAVGYVLKRAQAALRAGMDAALHEHDLTVPQYSCLEQLAHQPGLTNAELARGTFVSRQAMHQLLTTLKSLDLVQGDGGGRHEHFTLTNTGVRRLHGASIAVAAVQERMLAPFGSEERRRLYADLTACANALSQ